MLPKKVSLKNAVVRDQPMIGFRYRGLDNRSGNCGVVVGREVVADVVHESAQNIFFVAAVAFGAGRSLQAVLEAIDRKAAEVVAQVFELFDEPVGHVRLCDSKLHHDVVPVGLGRLAERGEFRSRVVFVLG